MLFSGVGLLGPKNPIQSNPIPRYQPCVVCYSCVCRFQGFTAVYLCFFVVVLSVGCLRGWRGRRRRSCSVYLGTEWAPSWCARVPRREVSTSAQQYKTSSKDRFTKLIQVSCLCRKNQAKASRQLAYLSTKKTEYSGRQPARFRPKTTKSTSQHLLSSQINTSYDHVMSHRLFNLTISWPGTLTPGVSGT